MINKLSIKFLNEICHMIKQSKGYIDFKKEKLKDYPFYYEIHFKNGFINTCIDIIHERYNNKKTILKGEILCDFLKLLKEGEIEYEIVVDHNAIHMNGVINNE